MQPEHLHPCPGEFLGSEDQGQALYRLTAGQMCVCEWLQAGGQLGKADSVY